MDDVDVTLVRAEMEQRLRDKARAPDPYEPPAGVAGDCCRCGEPSARLVDGACAPCRDKYELP
jgi:hypothetical protein